MLIALISPVESSTVEVIGTTLEDVHDQLIAQQKPGFVLASAPVRMLKGEAKIESTGTFWRVDGVQEIQADDMAALETQVPEGWRMLSVRSTD
jgi:hypothetical protein